MFNTRRRQTQKRIEQIRRRKLGAAPKGQQDVSLRRKTEDEHGLIFWLLKPLPDFKRLGDTLERAGKDMSAKRYVFRRFVNFLLMAIPIYVVSSQLLIATLAGFILGAWIPYKLLKRKITKRNQAFLKLFPDAIDLIVRGLRSGLPVSESMVVVSTEIPDPVGAVFSNISNTMKLGVPMEKALIETAKKLDMTEFNFFTTSIVLQRETGGNLSEILNNLSEVLRSRFIMRMKIRAMSSEARASAIIIGVLPFVVIGAMLVINPTYLAPLWYDSRGNVAAIIAATMLFSGLYIMNRMAKFEI